MNKLTVKKNKISMKMILSNLWKPQNLIHLVSFNFTAGAPNLKASAYLQGRSPVNAKGRRVSVNARRYHTHWGHRCLYFWRNWSFYRRWKPSSSQLFRLTAGPPHPRVVTLPTPSVWEERSQWPTGLLTQMWTGAVCLHFFKVSFYTGQTKRMSLIGIYFLKYN